MRTVALPLLFLALVCSASAQTTYTTTQDACGGKAVQHCRASVTDQTGQPFDLILDTGVNTLQVNYPYPGSMVFSVHGAYTGFVANPDGTRNSFYGQASFESDDHTSSASFQFAAYYVSTCSGRGCGGTLGWHYRILMGSTVTTR